MLTGTSPGRGAAPQIPAVRARHGRRRLWFLDFYDSAIGKKAVMAVTGIILIGFLVGHLAGNLKIYLGEEDMNHYSEWLRTVGTPLMPEKTLLWIVRSVLILSFVLHIHAAITLTRLNQKARPTGYKGGRTYRAANWSSRSMRITGVVIVAYVIFHLADLTWGSANPDFRGGEPYHNVVESLNRPWAAAIYIVASTVVSLHLVHGAWSFFQSLGWNNPRFNAGRKYFAWALAALLIAGNVSFPIAVLTGVID